MANPLRHLAALLGTISGPIDLVAHSYGGAVISNAANGNEQVQALVFLNGWMPAECGRRARGAASKLGRLAGLDPGPVGAGLDRGADRNHHQHDRRHCDRQ
jgi:pimeloyl-ACP methyl ester carboxylesterase